MNKVTFSAFAVLMAAGLSIAADAQAREHGVTQKRERGVTQARVTRPESRQLHRETRGIERKEQAFRAAQGQPDRMDRPQRQRDSRPERFERRDERRERPQRLSDEERRELHRDLDKARREIYKSRRNR